MSSSPAAPASSPSRLPHARVGEIVALAARGLTARQIRERIPGLDPGAVHAAFIQAAELLLDEDLSLQAADPVTSLIQKARESAVMSEAEAEELAIAETKLARQERGPHRGSSRE